MEPLKAVLTMHNESTSILLSNVRINEKVDASHFQLDYGTKGLPRRITGQEFLPPGQPEAQSLPPVEKPLQEIPIEQ
mgnify:CR=1 FL=1